MKKYMIAAMILTGGLLAFNIQVSAQKTDSDKSTIAKQQDQYTCPMHPEVVSSQPGKCPECGMNLVKKTNSGETTKMPDTEGVMHMSHQQHMMTDSTGHMYQNMMTDSAGHMHQGHMTKGSESQMDRQHMEHDSTVQMRHMQHDTSGMPPQHKKK